MTVQYLTNASGERTGVILSLSDWEQIQQKLNEQLFYEGFRDSLKEIKAHQDGETKRSDARDLLNEL